MGNNGYADKRRCEDQEDESLWGIADRINQQIVNMRDFARIPAKAGGSIDSDEGVAINTVAWELVGMAENAKELTSELQNKLAKTDGGNGEVEEAKGDA